MEKVLTRSWDIDHPSLDIMFPNKFPSLITKIDFFGFREIPNYWYFMNTYKRFCRWYLICWENTLISSKYTRTILFTNYPKAWSISLWKVESILDKTKGMLWHAKVPYIMVNVFLYWSLSFTHTWLYPKNLSINKKI